MRQISFYSTDVDTIIQINIYLVCIYARSSLLQSCNLLYPYANTKTNLHQQGLLHLLGLQRGHRIHHHYDCLGKSMDDLLQKEPG